MYLAMVMALNGFPLGLCRAFLCAAFFLRRWHSAIRSVVVFWLLRCAVLCCRRGRSGSGRSLSKNRRREISERESRDEQTFKHENSFENKNGTGDHVIPCLHSIFGMSRAVDRHQLLHTFALAQLTRRANLCYECTAGVRDALVRCGAGRGGVFTFLCLAQSDAQKHQHERHPQHGDCI
jgi:hypothetical protein